MTRLTAEPALAGHPVVAGLVAAAQILESELAALRARAAAPARAACRPAPPPCSPSPRLQPCLGSRPTVALVAAHPARRQRAFAHLLDQQLQGQLRLGAESRGLLGHPAALPPLRRSRGPGQKQSLVDPRGSALPCVGREHPRLAAGRPTGRPQYCRATPTECTPCMGMSVVSTRKTPSRVPSSAPTACRCRSRNGWSDQKLSATKYCRRRT